MLKGDTAFDHFCWIEGDPNVTRYELCPPELLIVVGGKTERVEMSALVEFRVGKPELRRVSSFDHELNLNQQAREELYRGAARGAGYEYARITPSSLSVHSVAIHNWRSGLAWIAACRDVIVEPQARDLTTLVRESRRTTLGHLLAHTNAEAQPNYLAALFCCLQDGRLESDLATNPLCEESLIWEPGAHHE